MSIEFDVPSADAVAPAARELVEAGHDLLHEAREEPSGQTGPAAVLLIVLGIGVVIARLVG